MGLKMMSSPAALKKVSLCLPRSLLAIWAIVIAGVAAGGGVLILGLL
jgi:hypothetical protein